MASQTHDQGELLTQQLSTPGTLFAGRYRVLGVLGVVGTGEVYRVEDLKLGKAVALKLLSTEFGQSEDRQSGLLDEIRLARTIVHPNLCRIHELGEFDDRHFISMEFIDGEVLARIMASVDRPMPARALRVARGLCAGLDAAHAHGVLHLDLKPGNIMIDDRGEPRIINLGLSLRTGSMVGDTRQKDALSYLAPEQLSGGEVSVRTDLYALGLVLYELFTGRPAFEADSPTELTRLHREVAPAPPSRFVADLEPAIEKVILRCLAKDPRQRPASAEAVASALPGRAAPDEGPVLKTLLVSDLVASTHMVETLGDAASAALFERHDRLTRDLLREHGGREIDKTDGFLLLFERPIHAVLFACAYHDALAQMPPLAARVGIHLGEVLVRRNRPADIARGAKPIEVEGLAKPMTGRLMDLAGGRQTLMTRAAFDLARRSAVDETVQAEKLRWLAHGRYAFRGIEEPIEIFEVGAEGNALLEPPAGTKKATPVLSEDVVLGWRPAPGLVMPGRNHWMIVKKLGAGGFGEVWLAAHKKTRERRVFKFCYEASRLEGLHREIALFLLLKEELGDRDDIGRIFDWNFDEAPFFIESEYTVGGNLAEWVEARGGAGAVPTEERLELIIQVAEALAAAHSVGVLHKDVKPTNILIWRDSGGRSRARLTDFGIGALLEEQKLSEAGMPRLSSPGGTIALDKTSLTSTTAGSGTRLYLAPELIEGRAASIQADVYALGVMLYQMLAGDLKRALAPGWRRELDDELLRADVALAVDGDPERRLASCADLARRLRTLEERRAKRKAERDLQQAVARGRKRRRRSLAIAAVLAVFALTVSVLALRIQREARNSKQQALRARELAYTAIAGGLLKGGKTTWGNLVALEIRKPEARQIAGTVLHDALRDPVVLTILAKHDNGVLSASFSPDGSRLLTSSSDHIARIWDVANGEDVASLTGHTAAVFDASFSADGRRVVTASVDRTARIWNAETGAELLRLDGHTDRVLSASFNSDGSRVVTASDDHTARVWNAQTGEEMARIDGHEDRVYCASFSPDDTRILTCSGDRTASVWDGRTHRPLVTLSGHTDRVLSASFNSDGSRVVTGSDDKTARIWNAQSGEHIVTLEGHTDAIWSVSFSPDGSRVLTGSNDKTARIWDTRSGDEIARVGGHTDWVNSASFSPDGSRIVTGSGDQTARIWNLRSGEEIFRMSDHTDAVNAVAFSAGGNRVVTGSNDRTARIWNATPRKDANGSPAGEVVATIVGHTDRVNSASFSADGSRVVTGSDDRTARIWNAQTGEQLLAIDGHANVVNCASFSPDGSRVVTGSDDRTARIWNVQTGDELTRLKGLTDRVLTALFSSDGTRVLTHSGDGRAQVWNAQTGEQIVSFGDRIYSAAFSPDGTRVVTGSSDTKARVWNAQTGEELITMEGHSDRILATSFSADGSRVVTGSGDQTVRIWDAQTGAELSRMEGHTGAINAAAFSPDSSRVVTGAGDGTARMWIVTGDYTTYLRSRIRARTPLCLPADFRRETLDEVPEVAARNVAACERCVPNFFDRLGGAPVSEWETYVEAWGTYEQCLDRED